VVYKEESARGALGVVEIAVSLVMAVNKADSAQTLLYQEILNKNYIIQNFSKDCQFTSDTFI